MRILYEPQCSMRSYDGNGWLLSSDAQINKMLAYVRALPEDWEWTWTVPATRGMEPLEKQVDLPANVKPVYRPWPSNVLLHRFHFDMIDSIECLQDLAHDDEVPDVMLCEVPEHVRGWRAAQKETGIHFPIIAMFEHVDIYDETKRPDLPFFLRQAEGFESADVCAFPLVGMLDSWREFSRRLGFEGQIDWSKAEVWNALVDMSPSGANPKSNDKPTIFFAGRCSDAPRTKWNTFIQACELLKRDGYSFRVWFANPNESVEWDKLAKCPGFEEHEFGNRTLKRDEYLKLLDEADVVPVLYPQSHIYSVGFVEAIRAANLMVTDFPPTSGYAEESAGIVTDCSTVEGIASGLAEALSTMRSQEGLVDTLTRQYEWAVEKRSVNHNIEAIRERIEEAAK